MGIQETVRRQEEKLVAQGKPPKPQSQPASVDVQALRQMIEDVVRTELQTMRDEQPRPQPSEVDVQALQHAVQSVVRAELQPLQAAVTIMANAIQAQTDALMAGEGDEEDQDEPLPTALPRHTDDNIEDEQVYPPDEDSDEEELDDVEDEDEEGEGGEDEEGYPVHPPRPESPTHRLRRPGPVGILLGSGDTFHPSTGLRRWEPTV